MKTVWNIVYFSQPDELDYEVEILVGSTKTKELAEELLDLMLKHIYRATSRPEYSIQEVQIVNRETLVNLKEIWERK